MTTHDSTKKAQKMNGKMTTGTTIWWPKRTVKDNHPMFVGSEFDTEADGFWWHASNWKLNALLDVLKDRPDSFLIERGEGGCSHGWEIKHWRMKDGSLYVHTGGYGVIGCYGPSPFLVSSGELPGIGFNLCVEHFRKFFPQFAKQMGEELIQQWVSAAMEKEAPEEPQV